LNVRQEETHTSDGAGPLRTGNAGQAECDTTKQHEDPASLHELSWMKVILDHGSRTIEAAERLNQAAAERRRLE
jgi:hypothetical protein